MDCKKESNLKDRCTCTYSSCERQGVCCDCVAYHLDMKQLPGNFIPLDFTNEGCSGLPLAFNLETYRPARPCPSDNLLNSGGITLQGQ